MADQELSDIRTDIRKIRLNQLVISYGFGVMIMTVLAAILVFGLYVHRTAGVSEESSSVVEVPNIEKPPARKVNPHEQRINYREG